MRDWLWLEGGGLAIAVDLETGAIHQIRVPSSDQDFIDATVPPAPAWRLELTDGRQLASRVRPSITSEDGLLTLKWVEEEATVVAQIEPGMDGLRVRARVTCSTGRPRVLEYPIVGRLRRRDSAGGDWLLHPYATGLLVHDPVLTLDPQQADGPLASGFPHAPYPEGFSGATMQFLALGGPGGGLYVAVEDPAGQAKWLDAYRASDGLLELRIGHGNPDYEVSTMAWTPPVVLSDLRGVGWWEAAQRYRRWALAQPWCTRGPVETDPARPRWLFENVGLVTFGIDAAVDRSPWLRATHHAAGTSVLHVLGPDWARTGQDYVSRLPGGLDDWLPAHVDPNNLLAIRRQGDRLALFEFDLLGGQEGSDADVARTALQRFGQPIRSSDGYAFPFLCPTTDFTRTLHRERDLGLVRDLRVDGFYYDISANNVIAECVAADHPHRPGSGSEIAAAHAGLYRETRVAAEHEAGRPLAMGAEMINERFIGELDFYQARGGAAPVASFETDRLYERILSGSAELVPLFAAVYHDFGPVRTDGWAKLSAEQGDLVYWNLARVVAWGGLPQVNAEYSPLESLPGHPTPLTGHYFPLREEHVFEADADVMAFLGELAALRTRLATRFLAYGTMLEPPAVNSDMVELSWFHYNGPPGSPAYDRRGTRRVPAVVAGAWRHQDDVAIVLVNADRQTHEARVVWTSSLLGPSAACALVIRGRGGAIHAGSVTIGTTTSIVIEPRAAVALEARRHMGAATLEEVTP